MILKLNKGGIFMNLWILIGIVIIVVGFSLKLDVLAVVLTAGIATGLAAKMDFLKILGIIGKAFVDNRLMSIFLISFPVIAMLERYGLRERSAELIGKLKNATAGKILTFYMIIRSIAGALSIRIGGHIQFIRPLILPMAEAAAKSSKEDELTEKETENLKSLSASVENYGNFFSQNIFTGASGLLLIHGTLQESGYDVSLKDLALFSLPIGIIAIIFTAIQVWLYDRKILTAKKHSKGGSN